MSTDTIPTIEEDMQAVAEAAAARRRVPHEVAARIRERSRKAQEELLEKHGIREVAVDLIRSVREE